MRLQPLGHLSGGSDERVVAPIRRLGEHGDQLIFLDCSPSPRSRRTPDANSSGAMLGGLWNLLDETQHEELRAKHVHVESFSHSNWTRPRGAGQLDSSSPFRQQYYRRSNGVSVGSPAAAGSGRWGLANGSRLQGRPLAYQALSVLSGGLNAPRFTHLRDVGCIAVGG